MSIGASAALGFWLGGLVGQSSRPNGPVDIVAEAPSVEEPAAEVPEPIEWPEPPLYVCLESAKPETLEAQVQKAAAEMLLEDGSTLRLFRFVVVVPLPWPEYDRTANAALKAVATIAEACPDAEIILSVQLDPPAAWLEDNPDAVMTIGEEKQPYVSVASKKWREAVRDNLESLITTLKDAPGGPNVKGYVLRCLQEGWWIHPKGYDRSEANTAGFREWLMIRYETTEAFRSAWGDGETAIEMASVPTEKESGDENRVFLRIPSERRNVDYLRYVSENTAETLALLASQIKAASGHETRVYAPYGFAFGPTTNCTGYSALNELLNSEVDGFVSPANYKDFELDRSGGLLGAVHSVTQHGKEWFLLDDTLERNLSEAEGDEPLEAIRQRQNHLFAVALTQGMGLFWRVPANEKETLTDSTWNTLKTLKSMYSPTREAEPIEDTRPFGLANDRLLTVVISESGRFHQRCDSALNEHLLQTLPANALRAGMPLQICLLNDLLAGNVATTPFYLFVNAFTITPENRELLHTILRETGSTALWVYAPGYCNGKANAAANIAATVQMEVKPFEKPVASGSVVSLGGTWVSASTEFGDGTTWSPSFYIEDEKVNVIATYTESEKTSVAIAFLGGEENGDEKSWTSVYCAEPVLPVELLREILRILEMFQHLRNAPPESDDFYYFGPNSLAIHARVSGEHMIDLGGIYKVQDLLDRALGWPEKRHLTVPMEGGQTRILKVMPVALPEEASLTPPEAPDETASGES
ncbi:MAG: hypothetical protein R6V12_19600 [Candidatus Hydrogenedentota bacterium]